MKKFIAALLIGTLFGFGLAVGGMTNPQKVLAFLDVAGNWDPSLLLLMAMAVVVTFILFLFAHRMSRPLLGEKMNWPGMTRVDVHVIVGPILFGIGWGIGGICPGPAFQLVVTNGHAALWFLPAMLVGLWFGRPYHRRARRQADIEKAKQ